MMIPIPFIMKRHFEGCDSESVVVVYKYDIDYYFTMEEYETFCEDDILPYTHRVFNNTETEFIIIKHSGDLSRPLSIVNIRDYPEFTIHGDVPHYRGITFEKLSRKQGLYDIDCCKYHYPSYAINWKSKHVDMRPNVNGIEYDFIHGVAVIKEKTLRNLWGTWETTPQIIGNTACHDAADFQSSVDMIIHSLNQYSKSKELSYIVKVLNHELTHILKRSHISWNKPNREWCLVENDEAFRLVT